MARIRSIFPAQWTDEQFVTCSPLARLLAIAVRNECDDQGVFEWKPLTLKMRLLPADNVDVAALLEELEAAQQVLRYELDGRQYGAVRNFCRYQRPKKPNAIHPTTPEVRDWLGMKPGEFGTGGEKPPQREEGGGKEDSASLRSAAPAEAVAPSKPLEVPKAPDPPKPQPPAEIDLIGEMPADLRRSPPPKAADRIWGPLREALGLTDADRSFIGRLIRDHGEDAVCAAMAKLAERDLPADPKSQLKAMLKGQAHGQAEQARPNGRAERVAAILARVGGGPAPGGGDGAAPDAGAVLPAVPGGR